MTRATIAAGNAQSVRSAAVGRGRLLQYETRQTEVCAYLSAILLAGLGFNAVFGWWWADPVAAVGMTPFIVREGWQAGAGRDVLRLIESRA